MKDGTARRTPLVEERRRVPAEEWWRTEGGFFLLTEAHRAEEGPKAAAFLEKVLRLPPGSRLLDMACGWGRVSVELAAKGYRVVGVDCSKVLRLGRLLAQQRGVVVDLVRGDMRRWSCPPVFDAALLWGMSFGYFSDRQNVEVLRHV
ncbi:MAG: methyltransferase domain-containing protein, partial [Euryarchaeota archaeon]|nr:methyltransferase domain-containing protein [Euryarchaeota archaeon]